MDRRRLLVLSGGDCDPNRLHPLLVRLPSDLQPCLHRTSPQIPASKHPETAKLSADSNASDILV